MIDHDKQDDECSVRSQFLRAAYVAALNGSLSDSDSVGTAASFARESALVAAKWFDEQWPKGEGK